MLINDIDRSAHCLTFSERGREGERQRDGKQEEKSERERWKKKITHSLLIQYSFFSPHNLCFHGNHTIEREMERWREYRCIEKERKNTTGLQVMGVHVSSLIRDCVLPSWMCVCGEQ